MILAKSPYGPLGAPIRRVEVDIDPDDTVTIGFQAGNRSVSLLCSTTFAELRDYTESRDLTILARFAPGHRIACEDMGERLVFCIDGKIVFSIPRGSLDWTLYRVYA